MNLKDVLHSRALSAAKNFKESERALQEILREIDHHRVYYDLGYRSLMDYAISALGLTPDVAYNHCSVAKKSQDLPEVRKAISEGVISVSAVRHLAPILTRENQKEMVALASRLPQTELRREIARRNPEMEDVPERARYVTEDRLALELRISDELMKKLRRAQDLVSQSHQELATLEDTLEALVDVFLECKDPVKKAERVQKKKSTPEPKLPLPESEQTASAGKEANHLAQEFRIIRKPPPRRVAISAALKNELLLRTNGRCTGQNPDGSRCEQTRWLHFHHLKPLSQGGENKIENLAVLCSGHHRMVHRKMRN